MFQRGELQQIGRKVVVVGFVVTAFTLLVIVVDEVAGGGSDAIRATCVLFLWAGGVTIVLGTVIRMIGTRWSAPVPRPRPQRRSQGSR